MIPRNMHSGCEHSPRARRAGGTVLIITMWLVLAMASLALVLAYETRVEALCSANGVSAAQAVAAEQAAIQYVLAHVDGLDGAVPAEDQTPCQAVQVGGGSFWILRPSSDGVTREYGITSEASRVNLNTATPAMLEMLPDMTVDLAAAIVDWRDPDTTVTPGGAESEYYLSLADGYICKDSPLETVEELWLVKDMTREILFGQDTNRNGILDESDTSETDSPVSSNGSPDRGIYNYVTVYTAEPAAADPNNTLVNVNQGGQDALADLLGAIMSAARLTLVLDNARRERPFQNVLDFYFRTDMRIEEFRQIADKLTTGGSGARRGLINVNTAPREVLRCLPGLDEADVDALLASRPATQDASANIAWVAEALSRPKAVAIGGLITTRSYQFSADIVAVSGDGRAIRRCRVVVDASSSPPRVIYRQDLTGLGWPLEQEIITRLRDGEPLEDVLQDYQQGVW